MNRFFKLYFLFFVLLLLLPKFGASQCINPSINAQVATGPSTTVCSGNCANLTASVVAPGNATTSYSVASVSYSTHPYVGGSNVFATSSDDLWSDSISIGFDFCFYGQTYKKLCVGSNGEITFDLSRANTFESWVTTQILPNLVEHPGRTICGAYRDYDPFPGGVVRTYTTGVAPCRAFVVYWSGVTLFSCGSPVSSFQIALYEGSNQIAVNIVNSTACMTWNNGRGLIGIQNANATVFTAPPTRNTLTAWTAINESWRFVPTAAPSFSVNWAGPGGFTASGLTAAPCPTTTSTYTASLNYCGGTRTSTVQVVVGNPTVTASASSSTFCAPGSVTLTGSGATSYTWQTPSGNFTGSTLAVSPTVSTTYTLFGLSGACTASTTIGITVGTAPTINAFNLSGTICPGNTANAVATGALTYTWNPGGITGGVVALSPTTTTTYTILGSSGGCIGQTTLTIPVGPTPTITALSSPTSICVGGSATLTASGASTYTWNPGALTGSAVVVSPSSTTTYTVIGSNTLSCTGTRTLQLVVNTTPTVNVTSSPTAICVGSTATLSATGATTYTWMPGSLTGANVSVSPTVTTVYTVTGSNGSCTNTRTISLTVNSTPTVTASVSPTVICAGSSATLSASGATTYTWMPGSLTGANVSVSPTVTTTYSVTGSNGGCTNTRTVTLLVNPTPTINATATPTSICSGSGATVALSASGASTYTWNPGGLTGSAVTVTPGVTTTYTVNGTSVTGCVSNRTITVSVVTTPTVAASASSLVICSGNSTTLSASGATTYTWNPGSLTGANVSVSPTSTTTYTLTGANGSCTDTETITITVNPSPTVIATASPTSICSGASSTLSASGATSYTWMPGSLTTSSIVVNPTSTTVYSVTGSSGSCSVTRTVNLTVNTTPTVNVSSTATTVCSGNNATLTATGATTYTWMPGSLTGSAVVVSPAVPTTYTVTGANGTCIDTETISVTVGSTPTLVASASSSSICSGNSSTLTATGATSYTWNPGSLTGGTITVSPTTTTSYTVTGLTGSCSNTAVVTVTVTTTPTITATSSPTAICSGQTATLSSSGATTYTWNPGGLTGSTTTVSPSSTTVYTVTGANGSCTNTRTVSLTVNTTPTVLASASSNTICAGQSVSLTATGATTYTWNPGALTGSLTVVSPTLTTTYTVTGTSGSCSGTNTITITVNPRPTITATASPSGICVGGTTTLTASGAVSYTWNPGTILTNPAVVSPGATTTYSVRGVDALGCSNNTTLTVTVSPTPTVNITASSSSICVGSTTSLTATGATTYSWMPGSLTGSLVAVSPTITTTYTVTGDNTGCTSTNTITITVNNNPTVTASASPTNICSGTSSTLSASGATSYTWMPGSLTSGTVTVSPTSTTIYTVTGFNGFCSSNTTVNLVVTTTPTISAASSPTAVCAGNSATLTVTGATTYTWLPGSVTGGTIVVTPTATTIYTVTGANGNCTNTNTVTLTVNPNPTLVATSSSTAICSGQSATLSASGATGYTWNPGGFTTSSVVVSPTSNTTYTLIGTNGTCSSSTTLSLIVNPTPTVTASASPTLICGTGTATLTASGATSYTWNPGGLNGATVTVTPGTTTTYTVRGAIGNCSNTRTLTITVAPIPTINIAATSTAVCSGNSATLTGSGATTYTWMPGSLTTSSIVITPTTNTTYTLTGSNGSCVGTNTIDITVFTGPTVLASASRTNICIGDTITLSAVGASSYTWNPGNLTTNPVVVTPTGNTTYTVTGSNGICSSTGTVSIIANPTPTLFATSTPTALCIGNSATLTAFGATNYTWTPGGSTSSTVVVTPTLSTTYTLTGANGACAVTRTITLNVNPNPTITVSSPTTTICRFTTTTLTANGASSYTWMPGSLTGSAVAVSPTVTTIYTVTGTSAAGCSATRTYTINVINVPNFNAVSNPTAMCTGSTATLVAFAPGPPLSYTWMPPAVTGNTVVVSPSVTTVYTVTAANGAGCTSTRTVNLIVNTTPTVVASSSSNTLCSGTSATLTATGATNYTWTPGPLLGGTVVVTPTTSTTYTVRGANGNCINTRTLSITVFPSPTITAIAIPTTICAGGQTTLSATGATSYTWMPLAVTGSSVVATPTVTTIYTVTGSNGGVCAATRTVLVNVNTPTINVSSSSTLICTGNTATLTATGALSYTWMPIATTGSSAVVSPTVNTTYTVSGINAAGCIGTRTITINVTNSPTVVVASSSSSVCSGVSATLTASGATTYTWLPGPLSGSTVVVTPTVNTTYTIIGSNGACTNTRTISISVLPTPTINATASPTILCAGGLTTLTATGATSYTWMPMAVTGGTVVASPTITTIYTVTGTNGGICAGTRTVLVNVNTPTITAIASPTSICIAGTATLTASGANTYTWLPIATTGSNAVVNPTVTTTYTIAGTNTLGCTGAGTITLNVLNIPTVTAVSSATAVCIGSSATLTGNGATTYTWMPGTLTGTSVVVTPTSTTIYTVTGSNGACTNTGTVSLTVNTLPTVTAVSSPTAICSGASATLTGSGALTYSWMPGSLTGTTVVVNPTLTTTYTISGTDVNGCSNSGTLSLVVNTPTITASATPTSICVVGNVTLTANGASTYTWNPGALSGSTTVVSPTVTTTYTVDGTNSFGCTSNAIITVSVLTNPTVTAVASSNTLCSGYSATLTSAGALSYTWIPGGLTGATVVVTPTTTTTYSVIGVNGSCSPDTAFVTINVSPSPAGVVASSTGTITCLTTTTSLTGASTSTNISYFWNGPASYTSNVQNPTGITAGGVYTLSVTDLSNGCITTATTSVATNTAGPTLTLTSTGTITCLSNTVSIAVTSTVSGVTYTWTGPSSFTSNATSFTVTTGGWYYVNAFDPLSGCTKLDSIAAITDTFVPVTATITPATCTGSVTNNDGTITLGNFVITDKYDFVAGATYTGTASYATATVIPVSGVITNTLSNPLVNTPYTIRIFGINGCFKDTTLVLIPIDCSVNNSLGIAKAVSSTTLNANGSYDVAYKVVVKNTGFAQLNNVLLTENLSATFPAPTAFSVVSAPVITSTGSSLTIDPAFNGSTSTALTNTLTSVLPIGQTDTIVFTVNVIPNGVFGTFNNSVLGAAVGGTASTIVTDSSQVGLDTDPDLDGDPTNNNVPTPLNLVPFQFFGLTKEGSLNGPLGDGSYDITYTITVHNLGNDTLKNVVVKDSLFGTTIKNPATYTMKSGPTASGSLTANSAYNGNSDANLIIPASSVMAPGTTSNIIFTINVFPDTVTVISNYAIGSALGSNSVAVSDTSNSGNNPDTNSNGVWNEPVDNKPTVLIIEDTELFIPEGFTPDDDGKNDLFVIKGLKGKEATLTVFNRWGNKVYVKENYDNTWNGTPNVNGTLGNQKLPQGTYYYILEFKNGDIKPVNGFVVLQY